MIINVIFMVAYIVWIYFYFVYSDVNQDYVMRISVIGFVNV